MRKLSPDICALLVLCCFPSYAYGSVKAIANVVLNEENKGDYFLILTDQGRILFSPEDLLNMGLREIPEGVASGEEGHVYIDSLSPWLSSEFDEKDSVLRLTAEPALLGKTSINLSHKVSDKVFHAEGTSGFLNYGLSYTAGDDFDFSSFAVPLEAGIRSNGYLGLSNFSYVKTDRDEKLVRLLSSIIKDEPAELRRTIIGDFPAFSGVLGSGGTLGGLSISKHYSLSPYFMKYPGLDIYGAARTPADVEIYINDILVKKERLSPGEFEFLNMTNVSGAGDAVLVVRDAFGVEERTVIPYYASSMLLKSGLHDYSYNLGFKRKELGEKSFEYGEPALLGFHRIGLSPTFTGGFRAEADKEVVNAGPTATFLPGRLGEIDTALAFSYNDGRAGYGFSSSYLRGGRYLNGRLLLKGYSRQYANLAISRSDDKPRLEAAVSLGFRQNPIGSFSFTYAVKDLYEGTDRKRASIYYSRRLTRNVSLNAMAARTDAEQRIHEVFAGLTFLLGRSSSSHLGYSTHDGESTATATFQQNPPLGQGFGYRLRADRKDNDEDNHSTGGNAFAQYRGSYGIYSADFRRTGGENSYTFSTSGGVAFIGDSAYLTRPITDGFALVKVGDFENVQVRYNNQEMGATGSSGEILIPGLVSYHQNSISINDQDIPVNYEIKEIKKSVSVPYRGGEMVRFELRKLQGFTGHLFILEKGRRTEAEYWGLKVRVDDEAEESIVGKKGFFYLENLPAGKIRARLFMKERECLLVISTPESNEPMVDLGEVTCEMD